MNATNDSNPEKNNLRLSDFKLYGDSVHFETEYESRRL